MIGCWGEKEREASIKEDFRISASVKDGAATATGLAGMEMRSKPLSWPQKAENTVSGIQQPSALAKGGKGGGELPGGLVKEHDRWIVDQLQGDGQALPLTAGEQGCPRVGAGHQAQCCQDFCHLLQPRPPTNPKSASESLLPCVPPQFKEASPLSLVCQA